MRVDQELVKTARAFIDNRTVMGIPQINTTSTAKSLFKAKDGKKKSGKLAAKEFAKVKNGTGSTITAKLHRMQGRNSKKIYEENLHSVETPTHKASSSQPLKKVVNGTKKPSGLLRVIKKTIRKIK